MDRHPGSFLHVKTVSQLTDVTGTEKHIDSTDSIYGASVYPAQRVSMSCTEGLYILDMARNLLPVNRLERHRLNHTHSYMFSFG